MVNILLHGSTIQIVKLQLAVINRDKTDNTMQIIQMLQESMQMILIEIKMHVSYEYEYKNSSADNTDTDNTDEYNTDTDIGDQK